MREEKEREGGRDSLSPCPSLPPLDSSESRMREVDVTNEAAKNIFKSFLWQRFHLFSLPFSLSLFLPFSPSEWEKVSLASWNVCFLSHSSLPWTQVTFFRGIKTNIIIIIMMIDSESSLSCLSHSNVSNFHSTFQSSICHCSRPLLPLSHLFLFYSCSFSPFPLYLSFSSILFLFQSFVHSLLHVTGSRQSR